jgi:TPR repeat protein
VLRSYIKRSETGTDLDRGVAMATLGTMYTEGLNVKANKQKGREWFMKAAALKNKTAQKWLKDNPEK